jgi:hypothetical protein
MELPTATCQRVGTKSAGVITFLIDNYLRPSTTRDMKSLTSPNLPNTVSSIFKFPPCILWRPNLIVAIMDTLWYLHLCSVSGRLLLFMLFQNVEAFKQGANKMKTFNEHAVRILNFLHSQFPKASEIILPDFVDSFCDEKHCEAFMDTIENLEKEGYLTYQHSMFGRQLYSKVVLTERGLEAADGLSN